MISRPGVTAAFYTAPFSESARGACVFTTPASLQRVLSNGCYPFLSGRSENLAVLLASLSVLMKLASVQASRPFTHARYAPPTNCHPLTRLSCNRARPFPRESRSDHQLSTDDFPTRCAFAFPNRPEEPAFSRRRPRFSGSVQSAAGSSPTVTRCEPTSDVLVAAAPSIRTPHCFAVKPLSELV
jgi:hypothetical protein